ncbi:MAG TPA: alpha/beta hydrolase [Blastocatellia bacterium]|nr:alpha/beta hydrolase [Blastocatellia bacterium]
MSGEVLFGALSAAVNIFLIVAVGSISTFGGVRRDRSNQYQYGNNPEIGALENHSQQEAGSGPRGSTPCYRVEGSGPLLIYIAGLDGTGELFFKQAPALARSYRVMSFRSRDYGRFSYEDLADDVAALIRDAGADRATIVAESFGGGVAFTFALRYPDMVERLVIINSFARFRGRAKIRAGILLASALPFWATSVVRRTANEVALRADGVKGEDRQRFFKAIRTVKRDDYTQRLKLIAKLDVEDRLGEIHAPTLFIAGQKDLLVPSAREARLMAALMPNATVRLIPGAGHACLLGDRVRLSDILAEWIGR